MPRSLREHSTEHPFQITARCRNREFFPIPMSEVWTIMEDYLFFISHAYQIEIISFVLMSNHFHLIARTPQGNLNEAMNYFMSNTSRCINEKAGAINQLWGSRYHPSLIDCDHYLMNVYKYVYRNPVEAGLSDRAENYTYSTLNLKLGRGRINFPILADTILNESHNFTLKWINQSVDLEQRRMIERALKRPRFAIPKKVRGNKKKPSLATELY
ncbi:transposase [Bdellovibrio sp. HCB274]|uniref:transposase n=1 Tax=Bdellovibrio sp. HCB274 TaxID=3394361 RepID=UPI0039B3ED79